MVNPGRRTAFKTPAADGCENTAALPAIKGSPAYRGASPCARVGSSDPKLASSPSAASRAAGMDFGQSLLFGDGTFAASEEFVVHARHLPAGQCASSFASRGGSRGAIGPTILSIDLPVAPVAISTVLARLSHRRRAREAPRGSPCAGPFASDRALFAARQRANATPAKPTIGMIRSRTLEPWSRHAGPAPAAGAVERFIALSGVFGKSNPPGRRGRPLVPTILLGAPRKMGDTTQR